MKESSSRNFFSLALILAVAIIKTFFLLKFKSFDLFNSDQAVIGLMAQHILQGHPMVYYYGQGYMGSLEAFMAALLFKIGGAGIVTLQCAPFVFFLAFLIANYFLVQRLFGHFTALTASLLLAVSPPALSEFSVLALGGYPETLFFGTLTMWFLVEWQENRRFLAAFFAGLFAGIGFWVNNLIIFYFLAAGIYYFCRSEFRKFFFDPAVQRSVKIPVPLAIVLLGVNVFLLFYFLRNLAAFFTSGNPLVLGNFRIDLPSLPFHVKHLKNIVLLAGGEFLVLFFYFSGFERFLKTLKSIAPLVTGFLLGTAPAWIYYLAGIEGYRLIHGSSMILLSELPERFRELMMSGVLETLLGVGTEGQAGLAGFAVVGALLVAFPLSFYLASAGNPSRNPAYFTFPLYLTGVGIFICLFDNLHAARYLLPLFSAVPLMLALGLEKIFVRSRRTAVFFGTGIFLFYFISNALLIRSPSQQPSLRQDYNETLQYFKEKNIQGFYSDYWTSYPLTFLSNESVIGAPLSSLDRYPVYTEYVGKLDRVAYIYPLSHPYSPEENFKGGRIEEERTIGVLRIFIISYAAKTS